MRAGTAAAASAAAWSSVQAASTGACRALIIWLVMVTGWPGAGLRSAARLASRWAWAAAARTLGVADLGGGGFLGRVGDQPAQVVRGGGMGVQGVQGEVGAGVAEVVLFPPS